jgi:hypothetical protein
VFVEFDFRAEDRQSQSQRDDASFGANGLDKDFRYFAENSCQP